MAERVPPGRAGRLWLVAHLIAAQRGRDLLNRKHQLLRREQERLTALVVTRRKTWDETLTLARSWSLRAGILGGTALTTLFAQAIAGAATAAITYGNTMGVRHPKEACCTFPELTPATAVAGNGALPPAAQAHRHAVKAAVDFAVTINALRQIENELLATRRRLRGIERHRIPALERSLSTLQLRLDELEREEQVVTRMARRRHAENSTAS